MAQSPGCLLVAVTNRLAFRLESAVGDDGLTVDGRVNLQSELTTEVVEGLLARGTCGLPTLTDAAPLHRMYIRGLLDHWNKHMAGPVAALPIT